LECCLFRADQSLESACLFGFESKKGRQDNLVGMLVCDGQVPLIFNEMGDKIAQSAVLSRK
jgi:hypothetical protein